MLKFIAVSVAFLLSAGALATAMGAFALYGLVSALVNFAGAAL